MTQTHNQNQSAPTTRDKILTAAINLFSQRGFTGVSVRDLTREVGIKESSLYNHFRNKDELLDTIFTLFQDHYRRLMPPLEALDALLPATTPEAFLIRGLDLYKEHMASPDMGGIWRILHTELYRDPRARDIWLHVIIRDTLQWLEAVFTRQIALGQIKPLPPRLLAAEYQYPLFALLTEYNLLTFAGQDTADIEQRLTEHVHFFLDNVQP